MRRSPRSFRAIPKLRLAQTASAYRTSPACPPVMYLPGCEFAALGPWSSGCRWAWCWGLIRPLPSLLQARAVRTDRVRWWWWWWWGGGGVGRLSRRNQKERTSTLSMFVTEAVAAVLTSPNKSGQTMDAKGATLFLVLLVSGGREGTWLCAT